MPTTTGGETISERLTRLRIGLTRVQATIARSENNGSSFNIGGAQVSQVAYEHAIRREKTLESEIHRLEARLTGSRSTGRLAQTITQIN